MGRLSPDSHIFHQATRDSSLTQLTSLNERGKLSLVSGDVTSLKESQRRQHEERNEVTLRKVLHHLGLDVADVAVTPEHDRSEGNRLRDGEQQVQRERTAQHVVETASREQTARGGIREVVSQSGESEASSKESEGTTRLPTDHPIGPTPTASFSSVQSSDREGHQIPCTDQQSCMSWRRVSDESEHC